MLSISSHTETELLIFQNLGILLLVAIGVSNQNTLVALGFIQYLTRYLYLLNISVGYISIQYYSHSFVMQRLEENRKIWTSHQQKKNKHDSHINKIGGGGKGAVIYWHWISGISKIKKNRSVFFVGPFAIATGRFLKYIFCTYTLFTSMYFLDTDPVAPCFCFYFLTKSNSL